MLLLELVVVDALATDQYMAKYKVYVLWICIVEWALVVESNEFTGGVYGSGDK